MLTVGANRMCAPFALVSWPNARPTRSTKSGFQVAASATPAGKQADVGPSKVLAPRAPTGPSVTFITGMPSRSTGTVCQKSAPASMATFSSKVILDIRAVISSLMAFYLRFSLGTYQGAWPHTTPGLFDEVTSDVSGHASPIETRAFAACALI